MSAEMILTTCGPAGAPALHPRSTPRLTLGDVVHWFEGDGRAYLFNAHTQAYCSLPHQFATRLRALDGSLSLEQIRNPFEATWGTRAEIGVEILEKLYQSGILDDASGQSEREVQRREGKPRRRKPPTPMLTLALTSGCNLGCAYCYASAAENPKEMSRETWTNAINYYVGQWFGTCRMATLCLHGGGEPTLNPRRLIEVIDLFTKKCEDAWIRPHILLQTNGAFAPILRDRLVRENVSLSISLDGDAKVQDFQRPFVNGKSSFDRIIDNIRFLIEHGKSVGILSTVTRWSLPRMLDTVEMAHQNGISAVKFDPIEVTGRAKVLGMVKPDMNLFADNLIDCVRLGAQYGIKVGSSVSPDQPLRRSFCSVAEGEPLITPEGNVSTCVEVLETSDPLAEKFFIGKVGGDQLVQIDTQQVQKLHKRQIQYLPNCDACFLKRQCVGGCPAQSVRLGGDLYTLDKPWCDAMRKVNEATIKMIADAEIDPPMPFSRQTVSLDQRPATVA